MGKMPKPRIPDNEFIQMFRDLGGTGVSKQTGMAERLVYARRSNMERKYRITINSPEKPRPRPKEYPHRATLEIKNGVVIIGSDFHIWPGEASTALRAFKLLCKELKPAAVILNGDVLDFPKISRHPPIGWESAPSPVEEIEAAQEHLHEIAQAAGRARKLWLLGNHDARFETRLATVASEYKGLKGIHLSDHFSLWSSAWSCFINERVEGGATMVKHRFKGGQNATRANTLNAGVSMVTGHLHSQKVTPLSDYKEYDRYGVDSGCVADKDHKAFIDYTEDAPLDWRSGFAVLTYRDGRLMMPELVSKWSDKQVQFRGELIRV